MKYFRVTFVPIGKTDREWMMFQAESEESLKKLFRGGSIIDIIEVDKKTYEEYLD